MRLIDLDKLINTMREVGYIDTDMVNNSPVVYSTDDALEFAPSYYFDRNEFCDTFCEVFETQDEFYKIIDACQENTFTSSFHLFHESDEYYIMHLNSLTVINWYKHLGRTNTCNKIGFTLSDLKKLLIRLREELLEVENANLSF